MTVKRFSGMEKHHVAAPPRTARFTNDLESYKVAN
jgi:hypothetical protein